MTHRERFLAAMESVVPWERLEGVTEPLYPSAGRVGRQPIDVSRIVRMYCLQQGFGLSDEGLGDAIYDSRASAGSSASTWLGSRCRRRTRRRSSAACSRSTRYKGLARNAARLFSRFGLADLVIAKRWLMALNSYGRGSASLEALERENAVAGSAITG